MSFIFLVMLVGFAVLSFVMYRKAANLEKQQKQLPPGFQDQGGGFQPVGQLEDKRQAVTVQNLRVGDIVSYFGEDFVVEGKLGYNDDGFTWSTFMLVDGDNIKWLSVEVDDQLEVSLWEEVDLEFSSGIPEHIEYDGVQFKQVERGSARVAQTGTTGRRQGLQVKYYDYESSGNRMLAVEDWGNDIEVSVGEAINPVSLEIFPGGGATEDW